MTGLGGVLYLSVAATGGIVFLWAALRVYFSRAGEADARQDLRRAHVLFGVSILYLFALFAALLAEHVAPLYWPLVGGGA
jgi:protoheme IX farnesyltransferase